MKAITLHQPWAQLLVLGEKVIETRGFRPISLTPGEPLLIHASRQLSATAVQLCYTWHARLRRHGYQAVGDLPLGAFVGAVDFVDWKPTSTLRQVAKVGGPLELGAELIRLVTDLHHIGWPVPLSEQELAFGNYGPNRYGWLCHSPKRLTQPIPWRGALGIWSVPDAARRQVVQAFRDSGVM